MDHEQAYKIGTPGKKWTAEDKAAWLAKQTVVRTYQQEVLDKLVPLKKDFDVEQYGALSYDPARYPLFVVKTRHWDNAKPTILVTGGVHGYETSGVQGAIRFIETQALNYSAQFNIVLPLPLPISTLKSAIVLMITLVSLILYQSLLMLC